MAKQYLKWYENHKAAFLAGKFDYEEFYAVASASELKADLNKGLTMGFMWESFVSNRISITSQLMMSDRFFNHVSGVAEKELKKCFKQWEELIDKAISDKQTHSNIA